MIKLATLSHPNHGKICPPDIVKFKNGTVRLASKNHCAVGKAIPRTSPSAASDPNSMNKNPIARIVIRI
jgi:hypothetical protein